MTETNPLISLYKKLYAAKKEFGPLVKNKENPFHKSKYVDLTHLLEVIEPVLETHGLLLLQPVEAGYLITRIIDTETGESVESALKLPEIADPQKIGAAVTYYRRFTGQSLLGLPAADDDGNDAAGVYDQRQESVTVPKVVPRPAPIPETQNLYAKHVGTNADFVITFGKYNGKRLGDIGPAALKGYLNYLAKDGAMNLKGSGKIVYEKATEYLRSLSGN